MGKKKSRPAPRKSVTFNWNDFEDFDDDVELELDDDELEDDDPEPSWLDTAGGRRSRAWSGERERRRRRELDSREVFLESDFSGADDD